MDAEREAEVEGETNVRGKQVYILSDGVEYEFANNEHTQANIKQIQAKDGRDSMVYVF